MKGTQLYKAWCEFSKESPYVDTEEWKQFNDWLKETPYVDTEEWKQFNDWLKETYGFYFERNNKLHIINPQKKLLFDIKHP